MSDFAKMIDAYKNLGIGIGALAAEVYLAMTKAGMPEETKRAIVAGAISTLIQCTMGKVFAPSEPSPSGNDVLNKIFENILKNVPTGGGN